MKTLLLLAGRSRRFWPLAEKSFFPIAGKTLLEHQVERLREGGCEDILLVAGGHNIEQARALFPDIACIEQRDLDAGMRGALLEALPHCGTESILIVSSNDVIEPRAYRDLAAHLTASKADGIILAKEVDHYFPGGYLTVDASASKRIRGIVEKPGAGKEPSNLVNIVAHLHRDASLLLKTLEGISSNRDDAYERALDSLCQSHVYEALPYDGTWQAVKFPWHLLSLLPLLLPQSGKPKIARTAEVHSSAVVEGPVIIADSARILPNACIIGPAFIGEHTIVGNNALVRGSSIGAHGVIGFCTEVKGSLLADHVWMHMAYAGDSVIGENVSFGAGAITGNFRLDEEEIQSAHGEEKLSTGLTKFGAVIGGDCRIGIHVGINPGIKIGSGTFIASGCLVTEDVPEGSFVSMKEGAMHLRPNRTQAPRPAEREGFRRSITGKRS